MTETKTLPKQESYERKKLPPRLLGDLIKRVQLLSPKTRLSSLNVKSVEFGDWRLLGGRSLRYENPIEEWTEKARESLDKNLENLPKEFQEYVWGDAMPEVSPFTESNDPDFDISNFVNSTLDAVIRYENFLELRKQLRLTAKFALSHPSWEQQFERSKRKKPSKQYEYMLKLHRGQQSPFKSRRLPFFSSVRFEINENATFTIQPDEFVEAISENVDVRRIRECAFCSQIFWAKQVDQFCCPSPHKCKRNLHGRLNRAANKTDEERRAENDRKAENRAYKNKKSLRP